MTISTLFKWASIWALVFILSACGSTVQKEASLTLEAQATGPFFAGPNSLMANYTVEYDKLFPDIQVTAEEIRSVSLSSVTVSLNADDVDFSSFSSASLQFVSESEDMVSAAVLNPIDASGNTITLQASNEADLSTFFKSDAFTCVLDLDFNNDDYRDELTATLNMNFNTTLKQ